MIHSCPLVGSCSIGSLKIVHAWFQLKRNFSALALCDFSSFKLIFFLELLSVLLPYHCGILM